MGVLPRGSLLLVESCSEDIIMFCVLGNGGSTTWHLLLVESCSEEIILLYVLGNGGSTTWHSAVGGEL